MHLYTCTNGQERRYVFVWNTVSYAKRVWNISSKGEEHPPMVQITALTGDTLAELDKDLYTRMVEDGRSVKDLKQVLATETGFSRFRRRLLVDGIGRLEDDMPVASVASMQLVILDFVADERSQKELMRACRKNRTGKVEKLLQEPQDPNGSGGNIPIHAAAKGGHLQVLYCSCCWKPELIQMQQ